MIEVPPSLEQIERDWSAIEKDLRTLRSQILPLNNNQLLKPLRLQSQMLEQANITYSVSRENRAQAAYTKEDILNFWDALNQHPDEQNDPKILRIVVKHILNLPVIELAHNPSIQALLDRSPDIFVNKLWLRRFYFFFFDSLYQQQPDTVIQPWARRMAQMARAFSAETLRPRYQALLAIVADFFSLEAGLLAELFEARLADLLKAAPDDALNTLDALEGYYKEALGFDSLPQGIQLYCQHRLFDLYLARYLDSPTDTDLLATLLQQFCLLEQAQGRERFLQLILTAYGDATALRSLASPLKACIKAFLLETIGDPRLNGPAWLSLKDQALETYTSLRYWFVAADFEFFFNFAFKNSWDPHARKELWMKFLKQAHDFRVFLPNHSYREFLASNQDKNQAAQVYKNYDDITGFLLRVDNLLIYEAVETPNAAYIYDLDELAQYTTTDAIKAKRFIKTLFEDHKTPDTGTKRALAHTSLGPLPEESYRSTKRSRRFRHDSEKKWHYEVLQFLQTQHLIYPDPPESLKRKP